MEKSKKSPLLSFKYLAYDFVKFTAAIPGVLWFRTKCLYESDEAKKKIKGGAIVLGNHNGFVDPIYIMFSIWYRRHHFICTEDIYRFPLTWFLCIPINRENTSFDSLRGIVDHLKAGDLVSIFPEGGVNHSDGTVAAFKSGMVLMAVQSGCPIIPVYVLKRKNVFERMRVAIGDPVDVRKTYGPMPSLKQINEITVSLHEKEELLRDMCQNDRKKK